jgi:hypothetical protein
VEDGRLGRPCGPGRASRAFQKPTCDYAAIPTFQQKEYADSPIYRVSITEEGSRISTKAKPVLDTRMSGGQLAAYAAEQTSNTSDAELGSRGAKG